MIRKVFYIRFSGIVVFFIISLFFQKFSFAAVVCEAGSGDDGQKCCRIDPDGETGCAEEDWLNNNCQCNSGASCFWDENQSPAQGMCQSQSCDGCGDLGLQCCNVDPGSLCEHPCKVDSTTTPGLVCVDNICEKCGDLGQYGCWSQDGRDVNPARPYCNPKNPALIFDSGANNGWGKCCTDPDGNGKCTTGGTWACGGNGESCCKGSDLCDGSDCQPGAGNTCQNTACTCNTSDLTCTLNTSDLNETICVDLTSCGNLNQGCCTQGGSPCHDDLCCVGSNRGNICQEGPCSVPRPFGLLYTGPVIKSLQEIIGPVTKMLYYGGLAIGVFFIILSGYRLMTSEGDPQRTKAAQEQLTSAIIGIIFILLSVTILRVIIYQIIGKNI